MKKVTLVLFAAFLTLSVNAQTSSGNMMVGGNLSFASTSLEGNSDYQNNDKTTTIRFDLTSLSPSLGFRYHFGN